MVYWLLFFLCPVKGISATCRQSAWNFA